MQLIPVTRIPAQTFVVDLKGPVSTDGKETATQGCTMTLRWRQTRLYLDLKTADGIVCQGAICQNRADVIQSRSKYFTGTLHFFDLEGDEAPSWEGLNDRWVFLHVPKGEDIPEALRH